MDILGISCYYHDAAACLVRDGVVVAAAEEERFTRKKHDRSFPALAIEYCLKQARGTNGPVDAVAFYDKPIRKLERAMVVGRANAERSQKSIESSIRHFLQEVTELEPRIRSAVGPDAPILFSEHHLSHAASAFYASPFREAAVLTIDGVGEWSTTSQFIGRANELTLKREIHYPHSIGLLYATLTAFLGFEVNEGEYKVMGLASYGTPRYRDKVEQIIELLSDGSFKNKLEYFAYMYSESEMFSEKLVELLGPPRIPRDEITQRHMDIASSLQVVTEDAVLHLARSFRAFTDSENLALAGGVAHNVVANTRILEQNIFRNVFVQPASGDSGGAVGAALYAYYMLSGAQRTVREAYDTCLGPAFTNDEIKVALDSAGVKYVHLDEEAVTRKTAELIRDNFILGWFQGRMEFGPRALGCRSLLANPCNPDMKDILNRRVKFREDFRPFAPAVIEEAAQEFFDLSGKSPYMLFTPQVRKAQANRIPSVTHSDGSARVQTVSAQQNRRFYDVIKKFGELTGVPVVINTSYNVKGEPIVCTPQDAINCFEGTDIDFLVIGDYIVQKSF